MNDAERRRVEYVVMDSRAQYSPAAAMVLEVLGPKKPSNKYLRRTWGGQDAVLVLCSDWDGNRYTTTTILEIVP